MTVSELTERMSYREFLEWMEFYRRDPFGEFRADSRHALLCSLLSNIHRAPHSRSFQATDFYPKFRTRQEAEFEVLRDFLMRKVEQTHGIDTRKTESPPESE
jgi:hypothetical protein